MFATPQNLAAGLREAGYATDPVLVQIIWLATKMQKPILVEGPPGTGKNLLGSGIRGGSEDRPDPAAVLRRNYRKAGHRLVR